MSDTPLNLRPATMADLDTVAATLADAFDDDPWINWIVRQDHQRQDAIGRMFRFLAANTFIPQGHTYLLGDGQGAAMWAPPGGPIDVNTGVMLRSFPDTFRMTGWRRFLPMLRTASLMSKHHPKTPHWYLMAIGARQGQQGQGLGSRLMEEITAVCDRNGVPAYLENSKERNLPFYERHGFRVQREIRAPGGGPPGWLMWRDPPA